MTLITSHRSINFNDRPEGAPIKHLVFHYTELPLEDSLRVLTQGASENRVSAHYVLDEGGQIFSLVDEERRAWHAGNSFWRGQDNINDTSIGIEIVNDGKSLYTGIQMETLASLSQDIIRRHGIQPHNVVGHSDIAPLRKKDPGNHFDWAWLSLQGIGVFPEVKERKEERILDVLQVQKKLKEIGYGVEVTGLWDAGSQSVLYAFQSRFMGRTQEGSSIDSRTCLFLEDVCKAIETSEKGDFMSLLPCKAGAGAVYPDQL
ncbi:MAG: N-acetylmuramoyl-L-alanine amidase [bacterium]|nr:N-acetylmuramoyl-L-alanine amidase [bacterium]